MFRILKKLLLSFSLFFSFILILTFPHPANTCNKRCSAQYFDFYHISSVVFTSDMFLYLLTYRRKTRTL